MTKTVHIHCEVYCPGFKHVSHLQEHQQTLNSSPDVSGSKPEEKIAPASLENIAVFRSNRLRHIFEINNSFSILYSFILSLGEQDKACINVSQWLIQVGLEPASIRT